MKRKAFTLLSILALLNISAFAQNNYDGKYFLATVMKLDLKDEPCIVIRYCVLKFSKDSVEVSYPIKGYCNSIELATRHNTNNEQLTKKYSWNIINGKLVIPKFEKYNDYKFEEKTGDFIKTLTTQKTQKNDNPLNITLKGVVKDERTNELLPTARITLKKNLINADSDFDGKFSMIVENYRLLKFPDTLQISFTGYPLYKIEIRSIEELEKIFKLASSVSASQINPNNLVEEISYPVFFIKSLGNPYPVVPYRKNKKRKRK